MNARMLGLFLAGMAAWGDVPLPPRREPTEPEPEPDDPDAFFGHGWYPDSKPRRKPKPDPIALARMSAAEAKRARKAKKRLEVKA